jgi:hypothetical protein
MELQSRQPATRGRFSRLAIAAAILIGAVPSLALGQGRADGEIRTVLVRGADALLSLQGTYENACGDAYGPPVVDVITDTWEWEIGSGQTCWNIGGATAVGLLAAYERTRNPASLEGARLYGDTLREKYQTIVVDDPEGAEWEDRPFSADIEFLVRLARDSRDRSFGALARTWHRILTDNKSAQENVDRLVAQRLSLSGWDVASQIRAAIDVGQWRYARDMALRLLDRRADWEGVPLGGYDWTVLSHASLLDAFVRLPWRSRRITAAIIEFRGLVLNAQSEDGSWQADPQLSAYAVMGLDAAKQWPGKRRESRNALGMAFAFLRDTQLDSGGWGSPEYGESNAEVLMAVARLRGRELVLRLSAQESPGLLHSIAARPVTAPVR